MKSPCCYLLFALSLISSSAFAADMPTKAAPPPVVAPNWTGLYLGAGIGYGMSDTDTTPVNATTAVPFTTASVAGKGWLGKFVAGYDYQMNSNIVVGVFGSFDADSIKGTMNTGTAVNFFEPLGGQQKESSDWAVGARAGWLLTPSILTYFDAGYTQARFNAITVNDLGTGTAVGTVAAHNYSGWFLGGGWVTPLPSFINIPGLFLDTEYRYSSYGSSTSPIIAPGGGVAAIGGVPTDMTLRPVTQTITTTLVYKFNWTGH